MVVNGFYISAPKMLFNMDIHDIRYNIHQVIVTSYVPIYNINYEFGAG